MYKVARDRHNIRDFLSFLLLRVMRADLFPYFDPRRRRQNLNFPASQHNMNLFSIKFPLQCCELQTELDNGLVVSRNLIAENYSYNYIFNFKYSTTHIQVYSIQRFSSWMYIITFPSGPISRLDSAERTRWFVGMLYYYYYYQATAACNIRQRERAAGLSSVLITAEGSSAPSLTIKGA